MLSPIVLFTYNRLESCKKTIESLKLNHLSKESNLYIFSDGPKTSRDHFEIADLRKYLRQIKGFKSINISKSEENKGLAKSVISGVSQVFQKYENIIVIEDDLVFSRNFLDFMNQALSYYKKDNKVFSVSGYTLNLPSLPNDKDYYFGRRASSWGWGTWKSVWENIDWEVKNYDAFMKDKGKQKLFKLGGSDMVRMLKNQMNGKIDSWAIRFCFQQFLDQKVCAFPTKSKVSSLGFSKDASNTAHTKRFFTELDKSNKVQFVFDDFIHYDDQLLKEFSNVFSIKNRIYDNFRKLF